jgi:Bacterial protein of unknown function (DUF853)
MALENEATTRPADGKPAEAPEKPEPKETIDGHEIDPTTLKVMDAIDRELSDAMDPGPSEAHAYESFKNPEPPKEKPAPTNQEGKLNEGKLNTGGRASIENKRYFSKKAWDLPRPADEDVWIQDYVPAPKGIITTVNKEVRETNPDPYSAYNCSPQPDSGRGAHAMALVYEQRVNELQAAREAEAKGEAEKPEQTDDQPPAGADKTPQPEEGQTTKQPQETFTVASVDNDNGKSLVDLMVAVKANNEKLAQQTQGVFASTNSKKLEAVRQSGIFEGLNVDFELLDPKNPELPPNTIVAMVSGLDQHPAYPVVRHPTLKATGERQIETHVTGRSPISYFNPETGRAEAIDPTCLQHYNTAVNDVKYLVSHVEHRVGFTDTVTCHDPELNPKPAYIASLGPDLQREEPAVYSFTGPLPEAWTFNFAPTIPDTIESLTRSLHENGVLLVEATPIRNQELVVNDQEQINAYLNDPSSHQAYDTRITDDKGKVVQLILPGRFSQKPGDWTGYITPQGDENLIGRREGALVWRTVEGIHLRDGATRADPDVSITFEAGAKPGDFGYMLVDREKDSERVQAAQEIFQEDTAETSAAAAVFTISQAAAAMQLAENNGWDKSLTATQLDEQFALVAEDPTVARDYTLAIELAELYHRHGLPAFARLHAERAAKLMPIASAPHILLAQQHVDNGRVEGTEPLKLPPRKIEEAKQKALQSASPEELAASLNELRLAQAALEHARVNSPTNGDVYRLGVEAAAREQAIYGEYRRRHLPLTKAQYQGSVDNYIDYLQHHLAHSEMPPEDVARNLQILCKEWRINWELNRRDMTVFKTVLVEDTETGERRLEKITNGDMMQAEAARRIMEAWEAAEAILEGGWNDDPARISNNLRDAITGGIMEEWERVRPRSVEFIEPDPDARVIDPERPWLARKPLPPEAWADMPPASERVRWIYVGEMHESDDEAPIDILNILVDKRVSLDVEIRKDQVEVASATPEGPKVQHDRDIALGHVQDSVGYPDGSNFSIPLDVLNRHAIFVGATGTGKTTIVKVVLEQLPAAGVHWLVVECGLKPGDFYEMAMRMGEEQGEKANIVTLRPGLDETSFSFLAPEDGDPATEKQRVKACIDRNCNAWDMAYQMGEPFNSIFRSTLTGLLAKHGWDVDNVEEFPAANIGQTYPTLDELKEALREAIIVYQKQQGQQSDAGATIGGFFDVRIGDQKTFMGKVAERGTLPVNLLELIENHNVIIRLDHFERQQDREFMAAVILSRLANDLMRKYGTENNGTLRHFFILEEAKAMLQAAAQGDLAGEARVEALSSLMNMVRSAGAGLGVSTQTLANMDDTFSSQPALMVAARVGGDDRPVVAQRIAPLKPEESIKKIDTLDTGEAFIQVASQPAARIKTFYNAKREKEIREWAKDRLDIDKIKPRLDEATLLRRQVSQEIQEPEQAWLRTFATATVLGLVALKAGMEIPKKVPNSMQKQWNKGIAENAPKTIMRLQAAIGRAVNDRAAIIQESYHPAEVARSALASALFMLNAGADEEAQAALAASGKKLNQSSSAAFSIPQMGWIKSYTSLTTPYLKKVPNKESFATPLPSGVTGLTEVPGQRVWERIRALRGHRDSPLTEEKNKWRIYGGFYGKTQAVDLWSDMHLIAANTNYNDTKGRRRRYVAAELGYCGINDPRPSSWEGLAQASMVRAEDLKPEKDEEEKK